MIGDVIAETAEGRIVADDATTIAKGDKIMYLNDQTGEWYCRGVVADVSEPDEVDFVTVTLETGESFVLGDAVCLIRA